MFSPKLSKDCDRLFSNFISAGLTEHFNRQFDCLFLLKDFTALSQCYQGHFTLTRVFIGSVCVCECVCVCWCMNVCMISQLKSDLKAAAQVLCSILRWSFMLLVHSGDPQVQIFLSNSLNFPLL